MTQTTEKKTLASTEPEDRGAMAEMADEVRESAKAGQQSATAALRKFRSTVDEALRERRETISEDSALHSLRKTIVDAAIELADELVTARYEFHRSILRSADRVLSKSDDAQTGEQPLRAPRRRVKARKG
jgi:hypothetical protein